MQRIMYIEEKSGLSGEARIGRVKISNGGKSLRYQGRLFRTLDGHGFKANYYDVETGAYYWISGCKKRGGDRLYPGMVQIDEDVREEYWTKVRNEPENVTQSTIKSRGKYGGKQGRK
jgi:hypothetical protein